MVDRCLSMVLMVNQKEAEKMVVYHLNYDPKRMYHIQSTKIKTMSVIINNIDTFYKLQNK